MEKVGDFLRFLNGKWLLVSSNAKVIQL